MKREELNARHRLLEMGIGASELANVLEVHRQSIYSRLAFMSRATCALFEVLLVLPPKALHQPDAALCATSPVPNMRGWYPCMREVLTSGESYPDVDELFDRCEWHAKRVEQPADDTWFDETEIPF